MSWLKKVRYWWEERDLRNPKNWDMDTAWVMKEPSPKSRRRAVVSVSYTSEQFQEVARRAREQGKKTSAFIREQSLVHQYNTQASLDITGVDASETTWWISGTGTVRLADAS